MPVSFGTSRRFFYSFIPQKRKQCDFSNSKFEQITSTVEQVPYFSRILRYVTRISFVPWSIESAPFLLGVKIRLKVREWTRGEVLLQCFKISLIIELSNYDIHILKLDVIRWRVITISTPLNIFFLQILNLKKRLYSFEFFNQLLLLSIILFIYSIIRFYLFIQYFNIST